MTMILINTNFIERHPFTSVLVAQLKKKPVKFNQQRARDGGGHAQPPRAAAAPATGLHKEERKWIVCGLVEAENNNNFERSRCKQRSSSSH